jgi:hypothetical protein
VDRPTAIRAHIARAKQTGEPPEVVEALRRDYYAARARDYIREWISSDPAPTPAQRRELATLLAGGGVDAAA